MFCLHGQAHLRKLSGGIGQSCLAQQRIRIISRRKVRQQQRLRARLRRHLGSQKSAQMGLFGAPLRASKAAIGQQQIAILRKVSQRRTGIGIARIDKGAAIAIFKARRIGRHRVPPWAGRHAQTADLPTLSNIMQLKGVFQQCAHGGGRSRQIDRQAGAAVNQRQHIAHVVVMQVRQHDGR